MKWRLRSAVKKQLFADALQNSCSAIFTVKHLCRSLFNNYWKETPTRGFSFEYCEIFKKTAFLWNTSSSCSLLLNKTIVVRDRKIVWKHGSYCWYFRLNLIYLGWPYRVYIKTAKNGDFCWELLSKNYF